MHRTIHRLPGLLLATGLAGLAPLQAQLPRPLAEIAAGYAAKIAGSATLFAGRSLESVQADELAPEGVLAAVLRMVEYELDRDAGRLTVRLGEVSRTARLVPGLGVVLEPLAFEPSALPEQEPPAAQEGDGNYAEEPARDALPEENLEALDAALDAAFEHPEARTRAVLVVRGGDLLAERYGKGFDRDTPLAGWSMAKSLTATLWALRFADDDGELPLDEPIPLRAWGGKRPAADGPDPRRAITWRHALRMSTGLDWQEDYADPMSDVPRMLFVDSAAGDYAAGKPQAEDPGTVWSYSSGTTNLLCLALRESFVDDSAYHAFPHRALFAPLGMQRAVLEVDPSGTFVGSSFAMLTARDWARFGQLYAQRGVWNGERLLPGAWLAAVAEPAPGSGGRYGLHFWLNAPVGEDGAAPRDGLPTDLLLCDGFEGQLVAVVPSRELVVVRLGCTRDWRFWDRDAFLRAVLGALGE